MKDFAVRLSKPLAGASQLWSVAGTGGARSGPETETKDSDPLVYMVYKEREAKTNQGSLEMKRYRRFLSTLGLLASVCAILIPARAFAGRYLQTGYIESISAFTSDSSYSDVIRITASSAPGACSYDSTTGTVIVRFKRNLDGTDPSADRSFSVIMTAIAMGKKVTVQMDDSNLLDGQCQLAYVTLVP